MANSFKTEMFVSVNGVLCDYETHWQDADQGREPSLKVTVFDQEGNEVASEHFFGHEASVEAEEWKSKYRSQSAPEKNTKLVVANEQ